MTIKSGQKNITKNSAFSENGSVDLSYGGAPALGATIPDGESAPGHPGSTIVASGLGPNVNIHGALGAGGRVVIDGSTPGSSAVIDATHADDGKQSPSATSTALAAQIDLPPGSDFGHSTGGATAPEPS